MMPNPPKEAFDDNAERFGPFVLTENGWRDVDDKDHRGCYCDACERVVSEDEMGGDICFECEG